MLHRRYIFYLPYELTCAAGFGFNLRMVRPVRSDFPPWRKIQRDSAETDRNGLLNPPPVFKDIGPFFLHVFITDYASSFDARQAQGFVPYIAIELLAQPALNCFFVIHLKVRSARRNCPRF